jgi:predicted anti-sigma-YlaC factor YlaD
MVCGCSVQRLVVDRVGDALAQGGNVYATDDDVELVGAATPFGLKLIESLLADSPRHAGLLLAASRGFTQYAYAFVELPAAELEERNVAAAYAARERARRLYLRAQAYGLLGLEVAHTGFADQLARDPVAALAVLRAADVPLLYWTAASWAAAISLAKDNAQMLADLPSVQRLAGRALELDESYERGALHVLQISLVMAQPMAESERLSAARQHFDRAVALSAGNQAAPYVTYAEAVSIPTNRRAEFESMLDGALGVEPSAAPTSRLANEVFQKRARALRLRADQLF